MKIETEPPHQALPAHAMDPQRASCPKNTRHKTQTRSVLRCSLVLSVLLMKRSFKPILQSGLGPKIF